MVSDPRQRPTILLVEDNHELSRAMTQLLKREGYETIVASTGQAALKQVADNVPAAAIIDIHLPDIHGLVLSQKLREACGDAMPIIVLSGDNSMEVIKSLSLVGATYFFSKPVQCDKLLQRLSMLLQRPEGEELQPS